MVLHPHNVHMWNRCNVTLGGLERGLSTALNANIAANHELVRIMYDTDRLDMRPTEYCGARHVYTVPVIRCVASHYLYCYSLTGFGVAM